MLKQESFTHTFINKGFHIPNVLENTKYDLLLSYLTIFVSVSVFDIRTA